MKAKLLHRERRVIEFVLDMGSGVVLDFTNKTFLEFFEDRGVQIYHQRYAFKGDSKANRLRAFMEVADDRDVARIVRDLWKYRQRSPRYRDALLDNRLRTKFLGLIDRIESYDQSPKTDALYRFEKDETLEELISSIERAISTNPAVALDHLHTYCVKKFGYLLNKHRVSFGPKEPLHSRVGKYVGILKSQDRFSDLTIQLLKNGIGVCEKFNHIRNKHSLAHDNKLLDKTEARFIYDSIAAMLRFIKSKEADYD